jgi:hypothetical protein
MLGTCATSVPRAFGPFLDAREQLLLFQVLYRIDDVAQIIAEAQYRNAVDERDSYW